eukprot:sb/3468790/
MQLLLVFLAALASFGWGERLVTLTLPEYLTSSTPKPEQNEVVTKPVVATPSPTEGEVLSGLSCFGCDVPSKKQTCISLLNGCANCTLIEYKSGDNKYVNRGCNRHDKLSDMYSRCLRSELDCDVTVCKEHRCNSAVGAGEGGVIASAMMLYLPRTHSKGFRAVSGFQRRPPRAIHPSIRSADFGRGHGRMSRSGGVEVRGRSRVGIKSPHKQPAGTRVSRKNVSVCLMRRLMRPHETFPAVSVPHEAS